MSFGASSIKELRALTPEKLLAARRGQRGMAWPIADGDAIPDDQYRLYESGRFNDTPILVGYSHPDRARGPHSHRNGRNLERALLSTSLAIDSLGTACRASAA